jgi:hypothetical protein
MCIHSCQYKSIITANKHLKNVAKFKYFGTIVTNENCIHKEIKSRLNLGNSWYHPVQHILFLHLLSENLKIKTYKIIISPVILYGCETWLLTLRKEHRLRVSENRVPRRIFGTKREKVVAG